MFHHFPLDKPNKLRTFIHNKLWDLQNIPIGDAAGRLEYTQLMGPPETLAFSRSGVQKRDMDGCG